MGGRGSDAAKAEDTADPAREHAILRELIELAEFKIFVFQDKALGGGKCHGERVLSHRLGVAAAVGCHWHTLRELAQGNEVHASDHELDQPRAIQQLCLAGPQLFRGVKCQERASIAQRFGAGCLIELVRYTTALAPARASATIALRFSLSSKATTSGGRLSTMRPKISAKRLTKPRRICLSWDRRAGLERAQLELTESQLRLRGLLE